MCSRPVTPPNEGRETACLGTDHRHPWKEETDGRTEYVMGLNSLCRLNPVYLRAERARRREDDNLNENGTWDNERTTADQSNYRFV